MKMQEFQHSPDAASWIASALTTLSAFFWKFMPAPLGALVMVVFDMPKTRTELFWRLTISYIFSIMFADVVFDFLRTLSWLSFLDIHNKKHYAAVEFLTAGCGWSVLAGLATYQRRFKAEPGAVIEDIKEKAL